MMCMCVGVVVGVGGWMGVWVCFGVVVFCFVDS